MHADDRRGTEATGEDMTGTDPGEERGPLLLVGLRQQILRECTVGVLGVDKQAPEVACRCTLGEFSGYLRAEGIGQPR